jgi:polar amino acid transport system substrate-binding protein
MLNRLWRVVMRNVLGIFLLGLSLAAGAASQAPVRLVVGELPPFAMEGGEHGPGSLVEITQELAQRLGLATPVEFFPWQRALKMTEGMSRVVVLPLTRTPEREPRYRWLTRLYRQDFVFVARHGTLDLHNIRALKSRRIAILRGSPHKEVLEAEHFTAVFECATVRECMRMVQTGLADATYGGEVIHRSAANLAGASVSDFDYSAPFRSGEIWLAGSLDFSDADLAQWQAAMKAMRNDGSCARILRKYSLPLDTCK